MVITCKNWNNAILFLKDRIQRCLRKLENAKQTGSEQDRHIDYVKKSLKVIDSFLTKFA